MANVESLSKVRCVAWREKGVPQKRKAPPAKDPKEVAADNPNKPKKPRKQRTDAEKEASAEKRKETRKVKR